MAKYTTKDVARIKNEIAKQSQILEHVISSIKEKNKEFDIASKELDSLIISKREQIKILEETLSNPDAITNKQITKNKELIELNQKLEISVRSLNDDYVQISNLVDYLIQVVCIKTDEIKDLDSYILDKEHIVSQLNKAIDTKTQDKNSIINDYNKSIKDHNSGINLLKTKEKDLLMKIDEIKDLINKKVSDKESLEKQLENYRHELSSILEKSDMVKIMEKRLSPEYLKVFKRLPNRQK